MLSTHGWQKLIEEQSDSEDGEDPSNAIDRLTERFKFPLAGVELSEIHSEFEAMVSYVTQFISLATMEYQSVWWRLFHAPNKSEWSNILILSNLLFLFQCRMLERAFSSSVECSSGHFLRLFSSNLAKDLLSVQIHWAIC